MRKYFCLGAIGCSPGLFFKVVLKCGWEFAHRFFERITHFCERKSNSLVKKSESLPSLLCHSRGEENCSWALFCNVRLLLFAQSLFCKERQEQIAPVAL